MSTLDALARGTRDRFLRSTFREQMNVLGEDLDTDDLSVPLVYELGYVGVGSIIELDYELCSVVSVDRPNQRVTVVRGYAGTTVAAHTAGLVVGLNPRYALTTIFEALTDEIHGLPDNLFWTETLTTSLGSTGWTVDLNALITGAARVVQVLRVLGAPTVISGDDRSFRRDFRAEWDENAAPVLYLSAPGPVDLRIIIGRSFDGVDPLLTTTEAADIGIPVGVELALQFGAAAQVIQAKPAVRLQREAQDQSRAAEEVAANDLMRYAVQLIASRDRRLAGEARRLVRRWGISER